MNAYFDYKHIYEQKTLKDNPPPFDLIETILWENGEYFLLDLHKERLKQSAKFFSIHFSENDINTFLENAVLSFDENSKYRTRLEIKQNGRPVFTSYSLDMPDSLPVKVTISKEKIDKDDIFLYHKTSNRHLYNKALSACRVKGFFDVIFTNQDDEVTEGAITNVLILKDGKHYTPPVTSGVLPGVYREHLLATQEINLEEKVLRIEDLRSADKVYMINSVRKMVPAVIV